MKPLKPIEVVWRDSSSRPGWGSEKDVGEKAYEPDHVFTVGYLIKKTKHKLVLTLGSSCWGNYMDILTIPRCSVVTIKELVRKEE